LSCQAEKIFAKLSETKAPNPGEGGFSRQLLSLVQTCNRRINPSEKKDCFMKTKTSRTTNSMKRSSHHRGRVAALLIALVLACFALSQQARAVCQDGCLTNQNTVLGDDALFSNTGSYNTAIGFNALHSNTSGISNTATGYRALLNNTTGSVNTATGIFALVNNTTGEKNTANGVSALFSNTSGNRNTAIGWGALQNNTTGTLNVAVGNRAGFALTSGSRNIDIGNNGVAGESRTIRIGTIGDQTATFIAGISGATVPTGVPVIVDSSGHLGTTTSSARFKAEIKPMDNASEAILALKPVTFCYKQEIDPEGIRQFGLVAEDVEKVNPDLVARDASGKAYTVRYEAVNAMLLNEFLKEHKKVEDLEDMVTSLAATVKEQAAQIQKVSAQLAAASPSGGGLEARKSLPQIVLNNQ